VGEWPPSAGSWELLVNCTPLGGPSRETRVHCRTAHLPGEWCTT
jgi:hypothetical protein